MSQLNVDTIGSQTGTTISIASGHTLSGVASTNGITNLQQFRLNANLTSNAQYITANWEAPDSDYESIGSIVSESSGVFSFSATGKYLIILQGTGYSTGYHNLQIQVDSGDGTFTNRGTAKIGAGGVENSGYANAFIDVTSTNFKVKIYKSTNSNSSLTYGETDANQTCVTFIRIGDT
jgi:murein DD-endopeptidase MepM/ murein hydrolase activator NlpD